MSENEESSGDSPVIVRRPWRATRRPVWMDQGTYQFAQSATKVEAQKRGQERGQMAYIVQSMLKLLLAENGVE